MAAAFRESLPKGFYSPIKKYVITMEILKNCVQVKDKVIYDIEKMYGRLIVLSQKRDVTLKQMLCFELSPVPPSLFDDYGGMRRGNKAVLVHKLAFFTKTPAQPDVEVIDGNQVLHKMAWPVTGRVCDINTIFQKAVSWDHDVVVIFDQYHDGSTKTLERERRSRGVQQLTLTSSTYLPNRDVVMKSTENKTALINELCMLNNSDITDTHHTIRMYGADSIFKHEKADCNIIAYSNHILPSKPQCITATSNDTDVFVLLTYFCWKWECTTQFYMKKTNEEVIDINATVKGLKGKTGQIFML